MSHGGKGEIIMKKLMALFLCVAMLFCFAGCGNDKETIVVGYTIYKPMNYLDDAGELIGFDIELAEKTIAYLNTQYSANLEIEFVLIDWNTKEAKLADGTLDLVWNGMTITEQRSAEMCISVPYLYNKQVAVVMKADAGKYTTVDSMKDAIMTAEAGSAGETVIVGEE